MGFWGEGFFQSDRDLVIVADLSHRMGIDDLYTPEDPVQLRKDLDSGKLDAEFCKLRGEEGDPKSDFFFRGIKTTIVVLAAASMCHGATISDEYRQYIRAALKSRLGMYDAAKRQMAHAIDSYQNGVPLDLSGKGLIETMSEPVPSDVTPGPTGAIGFNLLDPSFFSGIETVEDECNACGKEDYKLQYCGRCHKARYCNKECQKKAWKKHKNVCLLSQ